MQKLHLSLNDLNSILSYLTQRIQADLSNWYGSEARLILPPAFQPRDWSFFIRYEVQVSKTEKKAILVKIRHAENMSIQEAIIHQKMNAEMWNEYQSLVDIRNTFTKPDRGPLFSTIRPLACYAELNAVVQEEADIRTLKSVFQSSSMWLKRNLDTTFETYMNLTGFWLRIFHNELGKPSEGVFFDVQLYEEMQENLSVLKNHFKHSDIDFTKKLISDLFNKYQNTSLEYQTLHNDFNSSNVFVTPDGKICSFDAKNEQGSLYIDLAKLIVDIEVSRVQIISNGMAVPYSRLQTFNNSLLNGYFDKEPVNYSALHLFQLRFLIEKWKDSEMKLESLSGVKQSVYAIGMVPLRSFFLKLLHRYVYDHDYGF